MADENTEAHQKLKEAGWEPSDIGEEQLIWRNPENGYWYQEKWALALLEGEGS